jgi:ornithine cyclodeaminase
MRIFTKEQIESVLDAPRLIVAIDMGLVAYSEKKTATAPVSSLQFDSPPGDVHIKSGAILGDDVYVVKIASGFFDNPKRGLPSSNGVMLLFSQKTGELLAILHDEGRLTDVRTGIAGAIAAKYLAPKQIKKIGIVGTGTQAREQLYHLQFVTSCKDVIVWGRNREKALAFAQAPYLKGFNIRCTTDLDELAQNCNLIVTATVSTKPLLFAKHIRPGTHITAVGADEPSKQEIDDTIFKAADLIAVDSLSQCLAFGDLSHAGPLNKPILELGSLIKVPPHREDPWITVADLTGVAVEDLQAAKTVVSSLSSVH